MLNYVDWFNNRRIHNEIGKVPQQSSSSPTTVRAQHEKQHLHRQLSL
jgi:hypothetical protein